MMYTNQPATAICPKCGTTIVCAVEEVAAPPPVYEYLTQGERIVDEEPQWYPREHVCLVGLGVGWQWFQPTGSTGGFYRRERERTSGPDEVTASIGLGPRIAEGNVHLVPVDTEQRDGE